MWRTCRRHSVGGVIYVDSLTKRYGRATVVDGLSFEVRPGRVMGFLGPNGAGKTTTLRMILGLVNPDGGTATFDGLRYGELPAPSSQVGAVLEDAGFHPGRSGRNHLRVLAAAGGHAPERVPQVLDQVGLTEAADRRVKGYSMGMRQRLAIAAALLGEPDVLILDEPANGLDPPGIRWMRDLLRAEADRGRAVLVSSHLLYEVAQSVDDLVIISRGVLRANGPLEQVLGRSGEPVARVRTADAERLSRALRLRGMVPSPDPTGALIVPGAAPELVGAVAAEQGVALSELVAVTRSLEDAFLELTKEAA